MVLLRSDPEYINWLKIGQGLIIMRDALVVPLEQEIDAFKDHLKKVTGQDVCGKCPLGDVNYVKSTWVLTNNCKQCKPWVDQVIAELINKNQKFLYMKQNSKLQRWSIDSWEIAKVYMPKGSKNCAVETDCVGLIGLMTNCRLFKGWCQHGDKVRSIRNGAMHSGSLSWTAAALRNDFDMMVRFIESLAKHINPQGTVDKLQQLHDEKTKESKLEDEMKIMKDRLEYLTDELERREECTCEVQSSQGLSVTVLDYAVTSHERDEVKAALYETVVFTKNNPELCSRLLQEMSTAVSCLTRQTEKVDDLEARTDILEDTAESGKTRIGTLELNQARLNEQFEELERKCAAAKLKGAVSVDHKGQLQYYTSTCGLDKPVYTAKPHSDGGFVCSVKVGGDTFTTTAPVIKRVDAEKSAARLALEKLDSLCSVDIMPSCTTEVTTNALVVSQEVHPSTDAKDNDGLAELNRLLSNHGSPHAQIHTDSPTADTWCSTVKFKATGSQQLPVSKLSKSKKEAEQVVAELVLSGLEGVPESASSAKNKLYAYCGANRCTQPQYDVTEMKTDKLYRSVVITSCIKKTNDIEIEGDVVRSEDFAVQSALDKATSFIKKYLVDSATGHQAKPMVNSAAGTSMSKVNVQKIVEGKIQAIPQVKGQTRSKGNEPTGISDVCGRIEKLDMCKDFPEIRKILEDLGCSDPNISIQPHVDADPRWVMVKVKFTGAKQLPLYDIKKTKKQLRDARDELTNQILSSEKIPLTCAGALPWDKLHSRCGQLKLPLPTNQEERTGNKHRFSILCACISQCNIIEFLGQPISKQDTVAKTLNELQGQIKDFLQKLQMDKPTPAPRVVDSAVSHTPHDYAAELSAICSEHNLPRQKENVISENNHYICELTLKGKFELSLTSHPKKKDAEKEAALLTLGCIFPECLGADAANAKNKLKEQCEKNHFPQPEYPEMTVDQSHPKMFLGVVICEFKVTGDKQSTEEQARQDAARQTLEKLQRSK